MKDTPTQPKRPLNLIISVRQRGSADCGHVDPETGEYRPTTKAPGHLVSYQLSLEDRESLEAFKMLLSSHLQHWDADL